MKITDRCVELKTTNTTTTKKHPIIIKRANWRLKRCCFRVMISLGTAQIRVCRDKSPGSCFQSEQYLRHDIRILFANDHRPFVRSWRLRRNVIERHCVSSWTAGCKTGKGRVARTERNNKRRIKRARIVGTDVVFKLTLLAVHDRGLRAEWLGVSGKPFR